MGRGVRGLVVLGGLDFLEGAGQFGGRALDGVEALVVVALPLVLQAPRLLQHALPPAQLLLPRRQVPPLLLPHESLEEGQFCECLLGGSGAAAGTLHEAFEGLGVGLLQVLAEGVVSVEGGGEQRLGEGGQLGSRTQLHAP